MSATIPAHLASEPRYLRLPYPISANDYWSSRVVKSKKTGKNIVITYVTDEARTYKQEVGVMALAAGMRVPLACRVAVEIRLYPRRPLDWAKRCRNDPDGWEDTIKCLDLGNCEKVLSDALNGIAWHDDKQIYDIHLMRCEPDDYGPRVELKISPIIKAKIAPELAL